MTANRTASLLTLKGAATRTRPLGGYTPRCRFLMFLRTISTCRPEIVMLCCSVFILIFYQVQSLRRKIIIAPQGFLDRKADFLDLEWVVSPIVLPALSNSEIDCERQ